MAFPLTEDRHPQKRKANVFGTFSQKVRKNQPEVERRADAVWMGGGKRVGGIRESEAPRGSRVHIREVDLENEPEVEGENFCA